MSELDDILDHIANAEMAARPIFDLDQLDDLLAQESPIELIFAWAFACSDHNTDGIAVYVPQDKNTVALHEATAWFDAECTDLSGFRRCGPHVKAGLIPQVRIGKYRVDFLVLVRQWYGDIKHSNPVMFVVECDGHDFHERTKEQAARDRKRDRAFQAQMIPVLRFTGSELWNRPIECAVEAWDFAYKLTKGQLPPYSRGEP